ncbi:hypothetical protein IQ235_18345 [Oscillatoriales cyanobacterium LEGE 11467]|uniref:Uncharacterized protein n=1 Tax=Zarconia navalis LEGE 11467 TaxID=1828826 RepID=A0A928VYP2_9CYAN|nr:hypothetical protein [Zarconia navalis]MBE9042724.1 hypothetical protein [Zarconia navalis LEGE 11467]
MFPKLLNLTLLYVTKEVNQILNELPVYPYQQIFSDSYLRQTLMARVFSQIPNRYIVVDRRKTLPKQSILIQFTTEEQLQIENSIYEAIVDLMSEAIDRVVKSEFQRLSGVDRA